jgi:phosphoglycerate dehydrogenase-like enzyme
VFENEPLPPDRRSPVRLLVLTPHIAGVTRKSNARVALIAEKSRKPRQVKSLNAARKR